MPIGLREHAWNYMHITHLLRSCSNQWRSLPRRVDEYWCWLLQKEERGSRHLLRNAQRCSSRAVTFRSHNFEKCSPTPGKWGLHTSVSQHPDGDITGCSPIHRFRSRRRTEITLISSPPVIHPVATDSCIERATSLIIDTPIRALCYSRG